MRSLFAMIARGGCLALMVAGCAHQPAPGSDSARLSVPSSYLSAAVSKRADFKQEPRSEDARRISDWVVDSGDNGGVPFVIVDKVNAKVYVFDAEGQLKGAAPVLIGLAQGDDAVPGIGNRKLSEIRAEERTTPAGRFPASLGYSSQGKDMLWVDYEGAVSLHRVVTNNPTERRLERLASPKPQDRRISYGCINVPAEFYDDLVKPTFTGKTGVVYVLPDTHSIREIFRSFYDVELGRKTAASAALEDHSNR